MQSRVHLTFGEYTLESMEQLSTHFVQFYTASKSSQCGKFFCKLFDKSRANLSAITNEVEIMRAVGHRGVIQIADTFDTDYGYAIFMPKAGTDLLEFVMHNGGLPNDTAANILKQVLEALQFIHGIGICHRDIKLENILLYDSDNWENMTNPKALICDFGFAKLLKAGETCTDRLGTKYYIAPEIFDGKPYNSKVDIYSLGITLFMMVTGQRPFDENDYPLDSIHQQIDCSRFDCMDTDLIDLIHCMTKQNPNERPDAADCLNHPWIMNNTSEIEVPPSPQPQPRLSDDDDGYGISFEDEYVF